MDGPQSVRPSVRPYVRPSVRPFVLPTFTLSVLSDDGDDRSRGRDLDRDTAHFPAMLLRDRPFTFLIRQRRRRLSFARWVRQCCLCLWKMAMYLDVDKRPSENFPYEYDVAIICKCA